MSDLIYSLCKNSMAYLHRHAASIKNTCAMFGLNQSECCLDESAGNFRGSQQNEIALSAERLN